MIVIGLFAVITLAILAEAIVKPNFYKYVIMLFSMVSGLVFAYSFFEPLSKIVSKINWFPAAAEGLSFVLLFGISFAILKLLGDFTIRPELKLPDIVNRSFSVLFSLIFSFFVTGMIVVFLSMMPMEAKYPYPRYANKPIVTNSNYQIAPDKTFLNLDSAVTGFYNMLSAGSLSGDKDFGIVHDNFIDTNFLDRALYEEGVSPIAGEKAIDVPDVPQAAREAPKLLKYAETNQVVKKINNKKLYLVKVEISQDKVKNGGIIEKGGGYEIGPAQLRLICNKNYSDMFKGDGLSVFPVGFVTDNSKFQKFDLKSKFNLLPHKPNKNKNAVLDVGFYVPEGYVPVAVELRQDAIAKVPNVNAEPEEETEENG
ncbi:CvpA family protein [Sedimentisphaera salicampi]|uniref:Colicin V production protein n=1 Tax=Sedimentisphaera salicampi TaxID=1941349 RepID=A0A1W6LQ81_9BACT|nr:CvpA family protein [Sedimentisphaera salicampi]ARN57892.1 Colicin V production protein [Sedimentisphaera salicampi]OXU14060.1 Colicin V production protein [Sedimentisphaera salicampi]